MSEYSDSVTSIAQDILDELEVKTQADYERVEDDISDRIHESVDGSAWIIYYSNNLEVLENSNNADAIDDVGIDLDTSRGWRHILTQVAFFAMEADVRDELSRLKDELPEEEEEEEEEETTEA